MKKVGFYLSLIVVVATITLVVAGCTQQSRAFRWGGSATIDLPVGQKLVNITWKEDSLWCLTRQMKAADVPQTYVFQESSSFGMMQGSVSIVEHANVE